MTHVVQPIVDHFRGARGWKGDAHRLRHVAGGCVHGRLKRHVVIVLVVNLHLVRLDVLARGGVQADVAGQLGAVRECELGIEGGCGTEAMRCAP